MDIERFGAMVIEGQNRITYDQNQFERDTTLGAWRWWWALLSW